MKRGLIVRREAEADITEAALWYEEQVAGLGMEFFRRYAMASVRRCKRR